MLESVVETIKASSSDALVASCALTLVLLAMIIRRRQKVPEGLVSPPCLPWLPLVGSSPFIVEKLDDLVSVNLMGKLPQFFMEKSKELGNVIAFYSMSKYTVVLNGRKTIQDAFVKRATDFADRKPAAIEKSVANQHLNGIISCPFTDGVVKRRSVTLSLLRDLGYGKRAMEFHIQQQLIHLSEQFSNHSDEAFDPSQLIHNCVTGVIAGLVLGRPIDVNDPLHEHIKSFCDEWVSAVTPAYEMLPVMRLLPRYRQLRQCVVVKSEELFRRITDEVKQCLADGREESLAFKYEKKCGTDSAYSEDFLYIVRDLLIGGSETTQTTIRWMLILLANHDDAQRRLHEAIDEVLGKSQRLPSLDDVAKLPLVTATILETMRIETLAPFGVPHQTLCDTEVNGCFIPKGTTVISNLYSAHMDPNEWENPTEFRPERFLSPDGKVIGQERLIAFSMGKRVCPGEQLARAELAIFLTGLMKQFHVRPAEGQSFVSAERLCLSTVQPSSYSIRMIRREVKTN